jgi:hypothetical protein
MYRVGSLKQVLQVSGMVGVNRIDNAVGHLWGVPQSNTALPEGRYWDVPSLL